MKPRITFVELRELTGMTWMSHTQCRRMWDRIIEEAQAESTFSVSENTLPARYSFIEEVVFLYEHAKALEMVVPWLQIPYFAMNGATPANWEFMAL